MIYEIDWSKLGLKENPFPMSPPDDPAKAVWAGMRNLKSDFDRILKEARGSAPTQVILARGPVGGGKTHASLYFSEISNWPTQNPGVKEIHVLRVPTPKETGKPDRDFYIDVMEYIGLDNLRDVIRREIDHLGFDAVRQALRRTLVSQDLTEALLRLGDEEPNQLLDAYFIGKCTNSELRKLKLNRNIDKTQDYFRVIAGVFQCLTGLSESHDLTQHSRVCLWLDEMEDFIYFAPAQYRPFGQGLRELVDRVPFFFTLFLNFTLSSSEEFEEIELVLGKYLVDRVTQSVFFDELTEDEMLDYTKELLEIYAASDRKTLTTKGRDYFPFEKDALQLLFTNMERRTPRNVNKRARNAIFKAFERGLFANQKGDLIQRSLIQDMTSEELDKELG
ncbi:MAG: hypothetical protein KF855_13795 [Acidobacteria bacterium]|nr:hypothetical protein [Acidobacteriota bacterium]